MNDAELAEAQRRRFVRIIAAFRRGLRAGYRGKPYDRNRYRTGHAQEAYAQGHAQGHALVRWTAARRAVARRMAR